MHSPGLGVDAGRTTEDSGEESAAKSSHEKTGEQDEDDEHEEVPTKRSWEEEMDRLRTTLCLEDEEEDEADPDDPGVWELISANVTSGVANQDITLGWKKAAAVCVQEAKMDAAAQKGYEIEADKEGWGVTHGAPLTR